MALPECNMLRLPNREFVQDASGAKEAAKDGPVFITERGRRSACPADKTGEQTGIVDMLATPAETSNRTPSW